MKKHNINQLIGNKGRYMPVFSGFAFADIVKVSGLGFGMSILK
jgi:hypothetical protein